MREMRKNDGYKIWKIRKIFSLPSDTLNVKIQNLLFKQLKNHAQNVAEKYKLEKVKKEGIFISAKIIQTEDVIIFRGANQEKKIVIRQKLEKRKIKTKRNITNILHFHYIYFKYIDFFKKNYKI